MKVDSGWMEKIQKPRADNLVTDLQMRCNDDKVEEHSHSCRSLMKWR